MKTQQEDNINFLGRVLFMVLFLLVIFVHLDRVERNMYFSTHNELISEFHSISNHAVSVNCLPTPTLQKDQVTLSDKTGFYLLNENLRLSFDNCMMSHKINLQQKTNITLKPVINNRFQYQLFALDAEEPPLLS